MDLFYDRRLRRIVTALFERIQTISTLAQGKVWPLKIWNARPRIFILPLHVNHIQRRIWSVCFLAGAIFFGSWAHRVSQNDAAREWARAHPPSFEVVHFSLQSRGFIRVEDVHLIQKVMRKVPTHLDESGSFWLHGDHNWVVFFSEPDHLIQPQVYCQICKQLPGLLWKQEKGAFDQSQAGQSRWEPLGAGWEAFDQLMKKVQKISSQTRVFKESKPRSFRDPREMIY